MGSTLRSHTGLSPTGTFIICPEPHRCNRIIVRSGSPQELLQYGYLEFMDNMAKMRMKVHFSTSPLTPLSPSTPKRTVILLPNIIDMYGTGMLEPSPEKTREIQGYLAMIKDHPALLGYYIADEPDGQGTNPAWIKDTYEIIKAVDPYHPVTLVLNCMENPVYSIGDFVDFADIIMADPYPIGLRNDVGCDACEGSVVDVATRMDKYMRELDGLKPLWLIPQAFGGEQHWDRQPNARELRAMTYLGLIGGATGIQQFVLGALIPEYNEGIHFEPKSHMWGEARQLAQEIRQLTPALLYADDAQPPAFTMLTARVNSLVKFEAVSPHPPSSLHFFWFWA